MKVRHLIAKLNKCGLDDDIKFQIELNEDLKEPVLFRDYYKISDKVLCINFKKDS